MGQTPWTEWDDRKNEKNIAERGIDFAGLHQAFHGRLALVREDRRRDYGEQRYNMLVELNGVVLAITYTPRGRKYRIISARLANLKERRLYLAHRQKD